MWRRFDHVGPAYLRLFGAAVCTWLLGIVPAAAEVRRLCEVSYQRADRSTSEPAIVEVTFLTGGELNKKTRSYDYDPFSNYAAIWFAEDQVALLSIESFLVGVGPEFDNEDFVKLFRIMGETSATQVNGDEGRKWTITGRSYGRWVDPRAE